MVEDWSTIFKKKYSEEKGAQPSINENNNKKTMITNKKLGRRSPKRMPYEEPIGRDRSPTEC